MILNNNLNTPSNFLSFEPEELMFKYKATNNMYLLKIPERFPLLQKLLQNLGLRL